MIPAINPMIILDAPLAMPAPRDTPTAIPVSTQAIFSLLRVFCIRKSFWYDFDKVQHGLLYSFYCFRQQLKSFYVMVEYKL